MVCSAPRAAAKAETATAEAGFLLRNASAAVHAMRPTIAVMYWLLHTKRTTRFDFLLQRDPQRGAQLSARIQRHELDPTHADCALDHEASRGGC
jgi:hypothetical protein